MERRERENAEKRGPKLDEAVDLAVGSALHVEVLVRQRGARALLLVEVQQGLVELLLQAGLEGGQSGEKEIDDGDVHGGAVEALVETVGEKKRKKKRKVVLEEKGDDEGRI